MAKLFGPLTMDEIKELRTGSGTRGAIKAWSDGNIEVRELFRTGTPNAAQERMFGAAVEAEDVLTSRKLGCNQQAYWHGRLTTALGHLS